MSCIAAKELCYVEAQHANTESRWLQSTEAVAAQNVVHAFSRLANSPGRLPPGANCTAAVVSGCPFFSLTCHLQESAGTFDSFTVLLYAT